MTTIILGLGALTIVVGYMVRVEDKTIFSRENEIEHLKQAEFKAIEKLGEKDRKHLEEKENWKQTTNSWILEKEEIIERLEREKFDQLHELALMLNDSYYVDEIILEKAEKFDWLVNVANREQKRNFINGCKIK